MSIEITKEMIEKLPDAIPESGKCPLCKSDNLDYGDIEWADNHMFQEITCRDCSLSYQEWHKPVFDAIHIHTQQIADDYDTDEIDLEAVES